MVFFATPALAVSGMNENNQPQLSNITIYYPNGDWQFTKVNVTVPSQDKFFNALNLLLEPDQIPVGCYDEFPRGIYIDKFKIHKGTAYVSINENIFEHLDKNTYAIPIMQDILGYNIFSFDEKINEIIFLSKDLPSRKFNSLIRKEFFESGKLIEHWGCPKV